MALNKASGLCDKCHEKVRKAKLCKDPAAMRFFLCEDCRKLHKDSSIHCLEATIVVNGNAIEKCEIISSSKASRSQMEKLFQHAESESGEANVDCSCQACVERKFLDQEQMQDVQLMQKCWVQLRHTVRQIYRDHLKSDFTTGKGKKIDHQKIKSLVSKLCECDAHQLYLRLECQAKEYIMDMKVILLQVIISPEDLGLATFVATNQPVSIKGQKNLTSEITEHVAEHFLRLLKKSSTEFFDTLNNMEPMLTDLNEHLSKFGLTWRTVNYALFESVIYQDPLIRITLPAIYRKIGLPSVFPVIYALEEIGYAEVADFVNKTSRKQPEKSGFIELWRMDHTLYMYKLQMIESRKRMDDFLAEQMMIYQGKLKAKQKMLKQDLEFFKQKRRLLEEYVTKKKGQMPVLASNVVDGSDDDLATFADALRGLLCSSNSSSSGGGSGKRSASATAGSGKHCRMPSATTSPQSTKQDANNNSNSSATASATAATPLTKCPRCSRLHCSCDQCTVSHLITCGLVDDDDLDLPDAHQQSAAANDRDSQASSDDNVGSEQNDIDSSLSSDDYSESDDENNDSDTQTQLQRPVTPLGKFEDLLQQGKKGFTDLDIVCRKRTSITCVNGKKVTKVETTIMPTSLLYNKSTSSSLLQQQADDAADSLTRQIYHAYGDWEVSGDPTSLLLNLPATPKRQRATSKRCRAATAHKNGGAGSAGTGATSAMKLGLKTSSRRRMSSSAAATPDLIRDILAASTGSALCKSRGLDGEMLSGGASIFAMDEKTTKFVTSSVHKKSNCAKSTNNIASSEEQKNDIVYEKDLKNISCPNSANSFGIGRAALKLADSEQMCKHEGLSLINDIDSSSDRSSSTPPLKDSLKDCKQCDCCYCEMFGQGNNRLGREDFPQIRERLRMKLKNKCTDNLPTECHNAKHDTTNTFPEKPPNNTNINISNNVQPNLHNSSSNGNQLIGQNNINLQNNQSNQLINNTASPLTTTIVNNDLYKSEQIEGHRGFENIDTLIEYIEGSKTNSNRQQQAKKVAKKPNKKQKHPLKPTASKNNQKPGSQETITQNLEEVFKPKDIDLNSSELDEVDKEVEKFKRFVLDCQPAQQRQKIKLNLNHLASMLNNKSTGKSGVSVCQ